MLASRPWSGDTCPSDVAGASLVVRPELPDAAVTRQLLEFVERTSDLVGVVDEQSRVLYLNDAARKRLGVGDDTGLTTADLFPPEAFARYYDEVRPALLRSGSWHGELAVCWDADAPQLRLPSGLTF